ncbi:MAG: hypothetical protein NTY19_00495 [Planctomycetota bacterium]|nr:hypothetical protein [Planctomycetota bacterium]
MAGMQRREKREISPRTKDRETKQTEADGAGATAPGLSPAVPYATALDELHRAVDAQYARSPHLAVFEELQWDDPEHGDLLSLKAAELFEKIRREHPQDPLALHHLAVIYHGLGYRLQLAKQDLNSPAIVQHWRSGVQAWAALVGEQGFWELLRARWQLQADKNPSDLLTQRLLQVDLTAFRRHIPGHILKLHEGLVRDMGIILDSGFEPRVVKSVRKRLFESLALKDVDGACGAFDFDTARCKAERYLQIDPQYVPALCAVLRVCCEQCKHLGISGETYERRLKLLAACAPHAEQPELIQQAENRESLPVDMLRAFYLEWAKADLHQAIYNASQQSRRNAAFERALERVHKAVAYERHGGQEARVLRGLIYWRGARDDINTRDSDMQLARRFLDDGLRRLPNDAELRTINAEYYWEYGDKQQFLLELAVAERCNQVDNSEDATKLIRELRDRAERGVCRGRPKAGGKGR